jgi:hypothetical protein
VDFRFLPKLAQTQGERGFGGYSNEDWGDPIEFAEFLEIVDDEREFFFFGFFAGFVEEGLLDAVADVHDFLLAIFRLLFLVCLFLGCSRCLLLHVSARQKKDVCKWGNAENRGEGGVYLGLFIDFGFWFWAGFFAFFGGGCAVLLCFGLLFLGLFDDRWFLHPR